MSATEEQKRMVRESISMPALHEATMAVLADSERLAEIEKAARPFIKVHAGAEVARRVLLGGIEGPDRFRDSVVVVYLRDVLDALDGGSRRKGLLALGDTPEERIAKGRALLSVTTDTEPTTTERESGGSHDPVRSNSERTNGDTPQEGS